MATWIRQSGDYKLECRIEGDEVTADSVDVVVEENGQELERITLKRREREPREFVVDVATYTDNLLKKYFARFSQRQVDELARQMPET